MYDNYSDDYYNNRELTTKITPKRREPYIFTVTAINAAGETVSDPTQTDVLPIISPDAPTNVQATSNEDSKSTITFTPGNLNGASSAKYTVTAIEDSTKSTTIDNISSTTQQSVVVTGLTNGKSYTFDVTVTTISGTSKSGPSNTIVPNAKPAKPNIKGIEIGDSGKIVINFDTSTGSNSADVKYTAMINNSITTFSTDIKELVDGKTGTITVTGLTDGQEYSVKIKATNSSTTDNDNIVSDEVKVTPNTKPGLPIIISAVADNSVGNVGNVTIKFTPTVGTNNTYTINSSPVESLTNNILNIPQTSTIDQEIKVKGLSKGKIYTFTVTVTNNTGQSATSVSSSSVTIPDNPTQPVLTSPTALPQQVKFNFTVPDDKGSPINKYIVRGYYNKDGKLVYEEKSLEGEQIKNFTEKGKKASIVFNTNDRTKSGPAGATLATLTDTSLSSDTSLSNVTLNAATEGYSRVPLRQYPVGKEKKSNKCWMLFLVAFVFICLVLYLMRCNKKSSKKSMCY